MPSMRAMKCPGVSRPKFFSQDGSGFKALGARDETPRGHHKSLGSLQRHRFNALGAGDEARETMDPMQAMLGGLGFQCPRCGR